MKTLGYVIAIITLIGMVSIGAIDAQKTVNFVTRIISVMLGQGYQDPQTYTPPLPTQPR